MSFCSCPKNTGINPDLAFAGIGPYSCLPNERVLEKFPRSQHRPSHIYHQSLLCQCRACLLSEVNLARLIGVTTLF